MRKLLFAALYRFRFSWMLLVLLAAVSFAVGLWNGADSLNEDMCYYATPLCIAVCIALSLGREHGEGGFRNKLITGHGRGAIYFSEWLVNACVCLLLGAFFIAGTVTGAALWLPHGDFPAVFIWQALLIFALACISISTLVTAVCILITNRATGAILGILLVLGLIVGTMFINERLAAEEYYTTLMYDEVLQDVVPRRIERNPRYVSGAPRKMMEFTNRILPFGQIFTCVDAAEYYTFSEFYEDPEPWDTEWLDSNKQSVEEMRLLPLYALGFIAAVGAVGYLAFRKKDLK